MRTIGATGLSDGSRPAVAALDAGDEVAFVVDLTAVAGRVPPKCQRRLVSGTRDQAARHPSVRPETMQA